MQFTIPSLRGALATRQSSFLYRGGLLRYVHNDREHGNALWFILVAIALLGLLTVMMSRSSSTSNETGGYEQNVIAANEILSYAKSMENAVQGLLARGCSENDLSFWHDSDGNGTEDASDDYYNANSPTDHSCHIFDVAGAGMTFSQLTDFFPNGDWTGGSAYNSFVGHSDIIGVGTNNTNRSQELHWFIELPQNINEENFCNALNNISNNLSAIPTAEIWGSPYFKGTFSTNDYENNRRLRRRNNSMHKLCFRYKPLSFLPRPARAII